MRLRTWLVYALLPALLAAMVPRPGWGLGGPQEDSPEEASDAEAPAQALEEEPKESEPIELMTDAERVIRIERDIKLDEQKLEDLKVDLDLFEKFFQEIADLFLKADQSLVDLEDELSALPDDAPPEELSRLEDSRSRVQALAEILGKISDVAFTAESTTRLQIAALEMNLAWEYRAMNQIRGLAPTQPSAPAPALPTAVAPSDVPAPEVPGTQLPDGIPAPPARGEIQTEARLEALRALGREQQELVEAERAVIEFVKGKESLQTQNRLEERLLQAAGDAADLLRLARDLFQAEAEREALAGVVADDLRITESVVRDAEQMIENSEASRAKRLEYVDWLAERLKVLEEEEPRLLDEVHREQEEVKKAQKQLYWLESPLHPQNLLRWLNARGLRVLLVIVISALLLWFVQVAAQRTARVLIGAGRGTRSGRENRADTIGLSIRSVASVAVLVGGFLVVLQEAGVDVKTVLGGAAILGVGVAFGAQNMMRDYFSGFMILLEDQYGLGDLVTISGVTGRVETINMRTTVLRDIEGRVHFIRNGKVELVTNRTYEWGRAVLEIAIDSHEDVDRVMDVLVEICKEMRADPEWEEYLTDEPSMLGVDKFTEYGVVIKFYQQTRPDTIFPVRRELMRRIKNRFDELGIEIPVPQRTVHRSERES